MPDERYHHGNLREALVEEAVAVAREHGPDAVVVRELARRVGVSHNAAYRHFAHRDDLVAAVADRAHSQLMEAMERALGQVRGDDAVLSARRRLATIGRSYVRFALTEPGLFRVAFASHVESGLASLAAAGPYGLLSAALDELVAVGFLAPEARAGAEITCWSAVHGFSILHIDGPLAGLDPRERALALDQVLIAIDRSYAATTGATVDPASILATD
jgi:AcrR family transcriptional regulator